MKLKLLRLRKGAPSTPGALFVNGLFECYTLEDMVRDDPNPETPQNEAKVMKETAIPAGTYKVIINESPKFKRMMMRLLEVPGFDGILIHGGNTVEDSAGCILVGNGIGKNVVMSRAIDAILAGTSTPALNSLQAKVHAALVDGEEVMIQIVDVQE